MARRLPIYLLLDVSGSMTGEPITAVQNGVQMLVSALMNEPQALETAYLSVITFAEDVNQVVPLTELSQFTPPQLTAGGTTSLGKALSFVAQRAREEVVKNTKTTKGDWKPLVFIFTDGRATDSIEEGMKEFRKGSWAVVVACAAGGEADPHELSKVTEVVVKLDTADAASIRAFFKWLSDIGTKSAKSNGNVDAAEKLPPPPDEIQVVL